jgi:hypothetical protein
MIAVIYNFTALIVLIFFRFIYPDFAGNVLLLDVFWFKARLARGILTYVDMFPSIFMSALALPFAFKIHKQEAETRFSRAFFDSLRPHLLVCIIGTIIYTLLCLIAVPLLGNYEIRIQRESRLYRGAIERAELLAGEEKWIEAASFFAVCEQIWPENSRYDALADRIATGIERLRYSHDAPGPRTKKTSLGALPGVGDPLNAQDALALAKKALNGERYYDAHWLANTAERLAKQGSVEATDAARTASLAWNAIARMEPSQDEELLFSIYRRKREGYEALISSEWLRAYYIFRLLSNDAPSDPDVQKYLTMSERGLQTVAFFLDEMDGAVGDAQLDVVFSLPDEGSGRVVIRIEALTNFSDAAFGRGLEVLGFSQQSKLVFRLSSAVVKIVPVPLNGRWYTTLILRAVDRENAMLVREPVWTGNAAYAGGPQLLLDIPFEEFLLAAAAQNGTQGFFLRDLWTAAETLGRDGYVPQVFAAEIIRMIAEMVFFPAFAVAALIIGWKYRARFRVRYALFPMMVVMPLVFHLGGTLMRVVVNSLAIWLALSWGIIASLAITMAGALVLFTCSLFILAAQRSAEE